MADAASTPVAQIGRGRALCVAPDRAAAEAGTAILRQGGNAFDTAVAAGFMEAVVAPWNCGIGGYGASGIGFVAATRALVALDAGAIAPAAATPGMFPVLPTGEPNDFRMPDARHRLGPLSVAVPGVLAGLLTMLETWGRLDRRAVMGPAIAAARAGVPMPSNRALPWLTLEAAAEGKPAPERANVPAVVPMPALAETKPGRLVAPDPLRGTSHLAAADDDGNLVAWTQTHGGSFGSNLMVKGTGIVLGHGMCRFDPRPGRANSIAPGKRPLNNMAPLIAVHKGRAVLAAGASGGRSILNNMAALTIGRLFQGLELETALATPGLQCETREPAVLERSAGAAVTAELRQRGHRITETARDAGSAHLIARVGEDWHGAAEPRLAGSAAAAI